MGKKEINKDENIEFQIHFYESILKNSPDFIEALFALGDLYTKVGSYEQGLKVDERLSHLRPNDPVILYNLACSYSLVENVDQSLEMIKQAIDCGYRDFNYLESDSDLTNLRQDSRFKDFFLKVKTKK